MQQRPVSFLSVKEWILTDSRLIFTFFHATHNSLLEVNQAGRSAGVTWPARTIQDKSRLHWLMSYCTALGQMASNEIFINDTCFIMRIDLRDASSPPRLLLISAEILTFAETRGWSHKDRKWISIGVVKLSFRFFCWTFMATVEFLTTDRTERLSRPTQK